MSNSKVGIEFHAYDRTRAGTRGVENSLHRVGLAAIKLTAAYYALSRAISAGSSLARESMAYETGLARINTMLNAASERYLPQYDKQITHLAKTYGETATALQSGAYDILSATIAPADAMKVLEANVKAAKAGFTSTAIVTNASARVLKAYGLEASHTTEILDDMQATVERGIITFEDVSSNVGNVIGLSANLGVEFKAVMAAAASMTKAGLSADKTFMALKNIFVTFMNPTEEARKAAEQLGFSLDETSIKGAGLIKIVDKLRKANAKQLESIMPNVRGMVGFAGMLANATSVGEDYQYMLNSAGSVQDAFNKVVETSQFRADKLSERWKAVKRELGAPIAEAGITALERMADAMKAIQPSVDTRGDPWTQLKTLSDDDQAGVMKAYKKHVLENAGPSNTGGHWQNATQDHGYLRKLIAKAKRHSAGLTTTRLHAEMASAGIVPSTVDMQGAQGPPPIDWDDENKRAMDLFSNQTKDTSTDVTAAYRRMYGDIDQRSKESFKLRAELLEAEYAKTQEVVEDQDLVQKWYSERVRAEAIDRAKALGSLGEGFSAGVAEMRRDMETVGDLGANVAKTGVNSLASGFADAVLEGRKLRDVVQGLGTDVARMMIEWGMQRAVGGALSAIFPAPTGSALGNVFSQGRISAFAAGGVLRGPTLFPMANGMGLAGEAGPEAIMPLKRGRGGRLGVEASGGGGAPSVSIEIQNNSSAQATAETTDVRWDGRRLVAGIVLQDRRNNGPMSRQKRRQR